MSEYCIKKYFFPALVICLINLSLSAQNSYRRLDNPYYWKNKKPFDGYWQQDVYYRINASISEKTDVISGAENLTYYNNSPDTLRFVYFHLYQNAFVKGSYLDNLTKNNHAVLKYGIYERQGLGTTVDKLQVDGVDCRMELDNTIVKVYLPAPLLPNGEVKFEISFKTYFDAGGASRRRMKLYQTYGYKHYNGVQWYPRICVYDRKKGWDTDQHLNREFYGDYGSFDISLTFANNFIVEATGVLQNKDEVMPDTLRRKLDISNFKSKKWESEPSVIIPYDSTKHKTWRFHADNVHDFAWTADPTYRIGETKWNGVTVIAMAQEQHAAKWQNAAAYTSKIIETNSRAFGLYIYPKIVVADAADGMEYPMITMDGGADPSYRSLLAHEVSHQWFFGMLGNNETYRAMMDEGFTQFATVWLLDAVENGYEWPYKYSLDYYNPRMYFNDFRLARIYGGYFNTCLTGTDESMNQHSDAFNGALGQGGGYSAAVYLKVATMLYNLQYVLGDSLFMKAMQHYVAEWKICHPYPEDFRNSIIQFTHIDLNRYFDDWMETTKKIDYKVVSVHHNKVGGYDVKFRRLGRMFNPIDFTVLDKKGGLHSYYIPDDWFAKSTKATTLPKWYGWDKLNPTYTAHLKGFDSLGIRNVIIDPTGRLADINPLNNTWKFPATLSFNDEKLRYTDRFHYPITWRPDIWYNAFDGIQLGLHAEGNYLNQKYIFTITAWYNTGLIQDPFKQYAIEKRSLSAIPPVSFHVTYSNLLTDVIKGLSWSAEAYSWAGVNGGQIGVKQVIGSNTLGVSYKLLHRLDSVSSVNYPLYPGEWSYNKFNTSIQLYYRHTYVHPKDAGSAELSYRSPGVRSNYNYSWLRFTGINTVTFYKLKLRTRIVAQYGFGGNWANESYLWLAGANPEEQMDNKFTRAVGFVPGQWLGFGDATNHFQQCGGLDVRGFAGYKVVETDGSQNQHYLYKGTSGAAISAELELNNLITAKPHITHKWLHTDVYAFADAGAILAINNEWYSSAPRIDAGLGFALTIKRFGKLDKVQPFTFRIDLPFFITPAPFTESGNFAFRYVMGVNRSF